MILSELTEYCKNIGMECNSCPHYGQCEDYSEAMRHAPIINLDDEVDE